MEAKGGGDLSNVLGSTTNANGDFRPTSENKTCVLVTFYFLVYKMYKQNVQSKMVLHIPDLR